MLLRGWFFAPLSLLRRTQIVRRWAIAIAYITAVHLRCRCRQRRRTRLRHASALAIDVFEANVVKQTKNWSWTNIATLLKSFLFTYWFDLKLEVRVWKYYLTIKDNEWKRKWINTSQTRLKLKRLNYCIFSYSGTYMDQNNPFYFCVNKSIQ